MIRTLVVAALASLAAAPAAAQGMARPDPAAQAEMRRLEFLVGDWEGEGWYQAGPGNRIAIRQTESVRWRLDGLALLVDGLGKMRPADGGPEQTVHDALAVITWDPQSRVYRVTAWRGPQRTEAMLQLTSDGYVWGFKPPNGGEVRFTMRLTPEGHWVERGEFSPDGARWLPFMEFDLRRVRQ